MTYKMISYFILQCSGLLVGGVLKEGGLLYIILRIKNYDLQEDFLFNNTI